MKKDEMEMFLTSFEVAYLASINHNESWWVGEFY